MAREVAANPNHIHWESLFPLYRLPFLGRTTEEQHVSSYSMMSSTAAVR
jgi:hypothetical protein